MIESQSIFTPYLLRVLERAGCSVIATNHSVDCDDIVAKAPAVVLIDIDYFDRSGQTMLCRIRAALESVTLIALSEIDDSLFAAACVLAGASAVCSKTDSEEKLVRAIRRVFASPLRVTAEH